LAEQGKSGEVWSTAEAREQASQSFQAEMHGEAFRIVGERNIAEAWGRFVGRHDELRRIGEVLSLAQRGKRRILSPQGVPGSGRSRLLHETIRRIQLGQHPVRMYLVSCSAPQAQVPLAAIHELFRNILGIDEFDPDSIIRGKVQRLRELGLTPAEVRTVELALGLAGKGGERGAAAGMSVRSAVSNIAKKLSEDCMTVFAFDGAQQMDGESLAVLQGVAEDAARARFSLILAHTPDFAHPWDQAKRHYPIEVGPLTPEDLRNLILARLRVDQVSQSLVDDVALRTGGYPLHVELYLRALSRAGILSIDQGLVRFEALRADTVPGKLHGLLDARLAELSEGQRLTLGALCLSGAKMTPDLMVRVFHLREPALVSADLGSLEAEGLILRRQGDVFVPSSDSLAEAAVEALSLDEQRRLHGALAAALERLYPHRLDEISGTLAEHCRGARDPLRAIDYLLRSSTKLDGEGALLGALNSIERALDLMMRVPGADSSRTLGLFQRFGELALEARLGRRGAARMVEAVEYAEGLKRPEMVAQFSMQRGLLLLVDNRLTEGKKWLERARILCRDLGKNELLRDVTLAAAEMEAQVGGYDAAVPLLHAALELARSTGHVHSQVRALLLLAVAHAGRGQRDVPRTTLEEAQRLVGIQPDPRGEWHALQTEAEIHYLLGDDETASDAATRALEVAKTYSLDYEACLSGLLVGRSCFAGGDPRGAFGHLRPAYDLARSQGFERCEMQLLQTLAAIDATAFRSEEALGRLAFTQRFFAKNGFLADALEGTYLLGVSRKAFDDIEGARRDFREATELAAKLGNRRLLRQAEEALGTLPRGAGTGK
ncbi:MAG: AAA family ATPase, partial [Myxococcales bacterium]|nr:AAA family ATPase [Myxococcales bacterium]